MVIASDLNILVSINTDGEYTDSDEFVLTVTDTQARAYIISSLLFPVNIENQDIDEDGSLTLASDVDH